MSRVKKKLSLQLFFGIIPKMDLDKLLPRLSLKKMGMKPCLHSNLRKTLFGMKWLVIMALQTALKNGFV